MPKIPESRQGGRKYPWREMKPGDCYKCRTPADLERAQKAASAWAKRNGGKFVSRVERKKNRFGSVWREE